MREYKILLGQDVNEEIKKHLDEVKKIWLDQIEKNGFVCEIEGCSPTPTLSLTIFGDGTIDFFSLLKVDREADVATYAIKGWYPLGEDNAY